MDIVIGLSTLGLLLVTGVYAYLVYKQTEELRRQFKDSNRAYLEFGGQLRGGGFILYNRGAGPAFGIEFSVNRDGNPTQTSCAGGLWPGEWTRFFVKIDAEEVVNDALGDFDLTVSYQSVGQADQKLSLTCLLYTSPSPRDS